MDPKNLPKNLPKMSDKELYKFCQECARHIHAWRHKFAMVLPEVAARKLYKRRGFGSIYEFAAKMAGMSKYSVDETLRVLKKVENKTALKEVVESHGVNRVKPILSIVNEGDEKFWAEKARLMGKTALETYVKTYRLEILPRKDSKPENTNGSANKKVKVTMELSVELLEKLKSMKGESDWEDLMNTLLQNKLALKETIKETISEKGCVAQPTTTTTTVAAVGAKPEVARTKSRHIPAKIKRFVIGRSGGLCAYPGCSKPYKILHHTQRFALEKIHDPDRLTPLCEGHERIAHLGLIGEENRRAGEWNLLKNRDLENEIKNHEYKSYVDQFTNLRR